MIAYIARDAAEKRMGEANQQNNKTVSARSDFHNSSSSLARTSIILLCHCFSMPINFICRSPCSASVTTPSFSSRTFIKRRWMLAYLLLLYMLRGTMTAITMIPASKLCQPIRTSKKAKDIVNLKMLPGK
jgi:hypothetical protein